MKRYTFLIMIFLPILPLFGQDAKTWVEGKISYITSQNVYVKFEQAGIIHQGDTIYVRNAQVLTPLFITESVSSTSCVGKPLIQQEIKTDQAVFAHLLIKTSGQKKTAENIPLIAAVSKQDSAKNSSSPTVAKPTVKAEQKQKIGGRVSESLYSSFSNFSDFNMRFRYTVSLSADHISDSKFSTDTYFMFTYKQNQWEELKHNIYNALKIYSLSVRYDLNSQTHLLLGRNINPRLASVGAIDGFQAETTVKKITIGAVVGFNPDYLDYSFNAKLFEYGGYLSHSLKNQSGQMTNSMAFLQQTNSGMTDRRFVYFQHENSLLKNVNLFASCELDLYALENGIPTNSVSLTSLYLSLQYRFSRKLSVFGSYDARKNVIYYETYKTFLDQMLADATRQGYQFRVNYNPSQYVSAGASGGYRFRKNDPQPAENANGYLTFPQVPLIKSSVSFSANWINTSYVDGMIYGIRINRDLIPAKLSSGVFYRILDNNYLNISSNQIQQMIELEASWQISRRMSLMASYDGTFDKQNKTNSIYIILIKRF